MKTLLFVSALLLISVFCRAQNYLPFPDSAAIWVNVGWYSGQGFMPGSYYCANGVDTTINSVDYTRLEDCITSDYLGAFRDSAGVVYYVPNDSISEFVMYDFSAQPGDTVYYYREHAGSVGVGQAIIGWIEVWTIGNVDHRVLTLQGGGQWLEGVGCTDGFLSSYFANASNYAGFLYCASVDDAIRYGYSASGGINVPCDFYIGINELKKEQIFTYPNPTTDAFHFSLESRIEYVVLTDISGRSFFLDFLKSGNDYIVRVEYLPVGLYSLMILTEETMYQSKVEVR